MANVLGANGITGLAQAHKEMRSNPILPTSNPPPAAGRAEEIVAEIEGYQKVIDGARAVVENYRPHIHVEPDWPMVAVVKLVRKHNGVTDR